MQKELCTAHQKRRRIFIIYAPQCSLQMVVIIKVVIWHFSLSVDCPLLRAKAWPPLFRTGEAAEAEAVGPFCQSSSPAVWGPDRAVLLWIAQLATQRAYLTSLPLCHHNTMLQRPLSSPGTRMLVGCMCLSADDRRPWVWEGWSPDLEVRKSHIKRVRLYVHLLICQEAWRRCLRLAAATACRELRSSDHFLPRLEMQGLLVPATAGAMLWQAVCEEECTRDLFSGQRCDARLCLRSDGCSARRGMVRWWREEENEELGVAGLELAGHQGITRL